MRETDRRPDRRSVIKHLPVPVRELCVERTSDSPLVETNVYGGSKFEAFDGGFAGD